MRTSLGDVWLIGPKGLPNGSLRLTFPLVSLGKIATISLATMMSTVVVIGAVVVDEDIIEKTVDGQERSGKKRVMNKKQERVKRRRRRRIGELRNREGRAEQRLKLPVGKVW